MRKTAVLSAMAFAGLLVFGPPTQADLDVTIGNGDKVAGTLSPGTEVETVRVVVPAEARINVTAKGLKPKGGVAPNVTFAVYDPDGTRIGQAETRVQGAGAKLKKLLAGKTGEYRVAVSGNGVEGGYSLQVSWASRTSYKPAGTLAGMPQTFPFAADAGAVATFSVKAGKGAAAPRLLEIRDAMGATVYTFPPPVSATARAQSAKNVPLGTGGPLTLVVSDAGTGGPFSGAIALKPPKPAKRTFELTSQDLPAGTGDTVVRLVGPDGGTFDADDVPSIAGSSVSIPPGALGGSTAILIGVSTTIVPADPKLGAGGPSVFFGPEGLTFLAGLKAGVTIPYDPAAFAGGTSALRIFTRDADGNVSEITPVTVNTLDHTVTFAASHFSSFQAFKPSGPSQLYKVTAADGQSLDRFGFSCGYSSPRAVVGASFGQLATGAADVGTAYVYLVGSVGATQEAELVAGDGGAGERFAEASAISGDSVVVGASQHAHGTTDSGSAYVYVRNGSTWSQQQELRASVPVATGYFGGAVAISGDTIAVGSIQAKNAAGGTIGAVYVFTRSGTTWTEEAKIIPSDAVTFTQVGSAIALQGDTLALGRGTFNSGGAVWVYTRSGTTWTFQQKLEADTPTTRDGFGEKSIALDQDTLLVGVARTLQPSAPLPEAYVFVRSGGVWTKQAILQSGLSDSFGAPVALAGNVAVIGAPNATGTAGGTQGIVYRFTRSGATWSASVSFLPGDSHANHGFGNAIGIDASRFFVTAVADNGLTGSAYVFDSGQ
jgi:hypothetical protein